VFGKPVPGSSQTESLAHGVLGGGRDVLSQAEWEIVF
jgi:hypothetical protein